MPEAIGILGFGRPRLGVSPYPELADPINNAVDRWLDRRLGYLLARMPFQRVLLRWQARQIEKLASTYATVTDQELREAAYSTRPELVANRNSLRPVIHAFAIVREASTRVLGKTQYPVQLMGALALYQGRMVEMATGEGKTLTGLPAAVVAALPGDPVHVVTVNDYLAARDAEELKPVFDFFGMSVGVIDSEMDTFARMSAHQCDVTYISNNNLTFDYLRDRVATHQGRSRGRRIAQERIFGTAAMPLMLRGLGFAIVDEADSVFIDEARTPLILSSSADDAEFEALCHDALAIARSLRDGPDFELDQMRRQITLSPPGKARIAELSEHLRGLWKIRKAREELVQQALSALHIFHLGKEYIIEDEAVCIVDEFTGRTMPDRSWQGGLHQMIEAKEGLPLTGKKETMARITYQRFFRRYLRLAGMSGTCVELSGEILETYGLSTVRIPTHRKRQRRHVCSRFHRTSEARWEAVADAVTARHAAGQPVLVGTRSVEASEDAAAALAKRGLQFAVLNASQNADEAEVVAEAGQTGRITVATNIAGRGTDIALSDAARAAGGLHVILTEFHESARIDRQLYGRAGRQGDPGTTEAIVCYGDELFTRYAPRVAKLARRLRVPLVDRFLVALAQRRAEAEHATTRREQTALDKKLERALAFTGLPE